MAEVVADETVAVGGEVAKALLGRNATALPPWIAAATVALAGRKLSWPGNAVELSVRRPSLLRALADWLPRPIRNWKRSKESWAET